MADYFASDPITISQQAHSIEQLHEKEVGDNFWSHRDLFFISERGRCKFFPLLIGAVEIIFHYLCVCVIHAYLLVLLGTVEKIYTLRGGPQKFFAYFS